MEEKSFDLKTERLGPLPLINHFLSRLELHELFDRAVPTDDERCRIPYAKRLGILLRSIITEREPIYRLGEVVATFAPEGFGLTGEEAEGITDDLIGRALNRLFDADRGTLLTEIVIAVGERFSLSFDELHNDSTTIKFTGQYARAKGRSIRGKKAPWITYGYSKDKRPDLKQLLFILTSTADGGVPVQFRCEAGNASDSRTHEETWDALCRATGRNDFLYVADSKLCNADAMEYIDNHGGRFVTVMPRNRLEDKEFRKWVQDNEPAWEKVADRQNPRKKGGPRDRWFVWKDRLPSSEGWPVIWVFGSLLRLKHAQSRRERIARAKQELGDLAKSCLGPRARKRSRYQVQRQIDEILERLRVVRYIKVSLDTVPEHTFKQERRGRPGPDTKFVRKTKLKWKITWAPREEAISYDHKSDGMYPLLTNDRTLTPKQVLEAHKRQPTIEKRFAQTKSVLEIAPVLLKNEGRVEAFFFLYFVGLLVQSLIEREIRKAMDMEDITDIPLYPEERANHRPTAEQILKLFSLIERHTLLENGDEVQLFEPELTDLQEQVLRLLGCPLTAYRRDS
ncbi:MAG: IS1634 family transposase [Thermovirgaceae bacterium]|nr:IS1634 family transposase [Thermovirgaceae bacterium]